MYHYKSFVFNPIQENTLVVWDDVTLECAIIDCGVFSNTEKRTLSDFIEKSGLKPTLALQTHCHFDHIFGLQWLYEQYDVQPMCHAMEQEMYDMQDRFLREAFCMDMKLDRPPILRHFRDNEEIPLGKGSIRVIHTPGHTPGGVCFYVEADKVLISGDTLFRMGMGRTDLPGGNWEQEMLSIRNRLLTLPSDTRVICGHGPDTTIGDEQRH